MIINSMNYTNNPYLHESSKLKHKNSAFEQTECKSGVRTRDKNEVINSGSFTSTSEAAALNFKGKGRVDKILGSDRFANFLEYANDHNQTANALVALVTAGMVRPTLTMAIPGMKDKKDKIYSAAQAVSSGFLGFGVTMVLTKPLDDALKKAKAAPDKFGCGSIDKLGKTQMKTMDTLMKNIPEWGICVPRAMLTIALIPLILKYVFGLSKTPKNKPAEQPLQPLPNNFENLKAGKDLKNFASSDSNKAKEVSFHGKLPEAAVETVVNATKGSSKGGGLYDKFTDFIAKHFSAPLLNSKGLQKASDKYKDSEFLFNHVATVTSAVISGVYMQRTLANENLEDDKKKILAINQGLTFAISTSLSYLIDAKLNSWWERVTARFIGARALDDNFAADYKTAQKSVADKIKSMKAAKASKEELKAIKPLKALDFAKEKKLVLPSNIDGLVNGMGILKKMAIIGIIFRLAVPLAATPMASWLEDLRQKHIAKKAQA
ncbi:MAG: hypothetical protein NC390_00645 [Fusobacterium sp.]|nr:hypothetical protein [Fusobacterium sp.]